MSQYQPPAYQPPRAYQPPQQQPPPPYPYYQQQPVQQVVHYYQSPPKSSAVAVMLEFLPGFFFQTFGIGHIYAGNVTVGLLFMFGYWFVAVVNFLLCFFLIGLITWPLCFLATMIASTVLASKAASRGANAHR